MKKALSVVLSLLVILSAFGMFAAAEEAATEPAYKDGIVTIQFKVDGNLYHQIKVMPETPFTDRLQSGSEAMAIPTKTDPEGKIKYTFECWENEATGEQRVTSGLPEVPAELDAEGNPVNGRVVVYNAVFAEEGIMETQTFWAFVQTIFARINMIFEYFAKIFEGVFD